MESLVYTVEQVAELLQISTTSVYNLRNDGKLTQLPNISGVKFSKREVEALAGVEDEYNAIGYRKLQSEVESLRKENHKLKSEIKKITSQMLVIVGEDLIIAFLLVAGGMGSLELDAIDMWTYLCQSLLGVTLWLLSNKWEEEIEFYENKKVR